jgi:hypothetical protein
MTLLKMSIQTGSCCVVATTLAFKVRRAGFNPWSERYSRNCYLYINISKWLDFPICSEKQPRTQALWFVYVIKRTWDGTRGRKMENSAGSAW